VLLWILPVWLRSRSQLLLFNMLALAAVCAHLLAAGLGQSLGIGQPLRDFYALPILLATFSLPLSLFTFASISRASGFAWARVDWGHGLVCVAAVALLIYVLPDILTVKQVYPACWRDVIWYRRIPGSPWQCGLPPAAASLRAVASNAVAPVMVLLAYLCLGFGLWRRERWPWLLAAMVPGLLLLLLPASWGPMPQFAGETLCFSGVALVARRHVLRGDGSKTQPPAASG
jgi:hypothetical protein